MGLQKQSKKPYNKQLINLESSVLLANLKPWPCRIDLAIARLIRQGMCLRFSHEHMTLG